MQAEWFLACFGIAAIRDKIMQPFYTTKDIGKGTGLGLSLVQNIVRAHQGELVLNTKSPNTEFILSLHISQKSKSVAKP